MPPPEHRGGTGINAQFDCQDAPEVGDRSGSRLSSPRPRRSLLDSPPIALEDFLADTAHMVLSLAYTPEALAELSGV